MDLKAVIERDIQAEVSKAKLSPDDMEKHIRAAFMNGMVLGARLQNKLPGAASDEDGWGEVQETQPPM